MTAGSAARAVVALSHSPLIGRNDPATEVRDRVDAALDGARRFVRAFAPDLVVIYAPDHYNGFFYRQMPPFCLAGEAQAVGDFDSAGGPLAVDREVADALAAAVLARGVDLSVSARMTVDHGFAQPLEILFGGLAAVPVIPIFINCVALPLGPVGRARALGQAVGEALADSDRRVLFLASGGLSHDPPVPSLRTVPAHVADALIEGPTPTPQQRQRAEARVVRAGQAYAAGAKHMIPINPAWDARVLDTLERGRLNDFDAWTVEAMTREGGGSGHEVRTWIAAFAGLGATGGYHLTSRFYEPVPEWIAGFAVTTAVPK